MSKYSFQIGALFNSVIHTWNVTISTAATWKGGSSLLLRLSQCQTTSWKFWDISTLSELLELPLSFMAPSVWGRGRCVIGAGSVRQLSDHLLRKDLFSACPNPPSSAEECQQSRVLLTPHSSAGYYESRGGFQSTTSIWLCCFTFSTTGGQL